EPPAPPRKDDPRLHLQREALKAALQIPAVAGPAYDELPEQVLVHPAFAAIHRAVQAAGGVCSGMDGHAWLEAVLAHCPQEARGLVTEPAVEPLELPKRHPDEDRYVGSVIAGVRRALVGPQVEGLTAGRQRTHPVQRPDGCRQLFGKRLALE